MHFKHNFPSRNPLGSVYPDLTLDVACPMNFVWLAFAISFPSLFNSSAEVKANVPPILTTSAFMVISSPAGAGRK